MKKSILLATTALISAFALNANAVDTSSTKVEVHAAILGHLPEMSVVQNLDFGLVGSKGDSGDNYATVLLSYDGTYTHTDRVDIYTAPKPAIVRVDSWYFDINEALPSLALPESIELNAMGSSSGASCGTVEGFVVGPAENISGSRSYNIPFGGKWTHIPNREGDRMICAGEVTATLVHVPTYGN